ncbi:MAG: hypothetical protein LBT09_08150 [Planctomycetaceae bacterium]|jgi:hypothetical protein|nr:hypothetical protein [Planctomycetaceae bacterium]
MTLSPKKLNARHHVSAYQLNRLPVDKPFLLNIKSIRFSLELQSTGATVWRTGHLLDAASPQLKL